MFELLKYSSTGYAFEHFEIAEIANQILREEEEMASGPGLFEPASSFPEGHRCDVGDRMHLEVIKIETD
jgi:hypothetical protein